MDLRPLPDGGRPAYARGAIAPDGGEAGSGQAGHQAGCECCDRDLPPASPDARIRTFECTFCAACADEVPGGLCPNCGDNLFTRPIRPAHLLDKAPASTKRIVRDDGCRPARAARQASS